ILGQQVSVKGASTMTGRVAAAFGSVSDAGVVFPGPESLAEADLTRVGVTKQRSESIRGLAAAAAQGEVSFHGSMGPDEVQNHLTRIPGIGPWTAQYVAMRLGEPDAFPSGDLYLRDVAKESEMWRPWRAYAAMYLWKRGQAL